VIGGEETQFPVPARKIAKEEDSAGRD